MGWIVGKCNSLGLEFVDFSLPMLIQSGLVIAVLLLVDLLLRKKVRAVVRYWLWMLVLVKLLLPVGLTLPTNPGYWVQADWQGSPAPAELEYFSVDEVRASETVPCGIETRVKAPPVVGRASIEPSQPPALFTHLTLQARLFLIWAGTVMVMILLAIHRARYVSRLIAGTREAAEPIRELLASCSMQLGMKRSVGVRISAGMASPAVCGLRRPVILIPETLASGLALDKLRAVLLHELGHIKRGDLWVNLAQTVLQIAYFYNPLLWLANAAIRRAREQAVDEMVLVAMGDKAEEYPGTLLSVAKFSFPSSGLALRLIGVVESESALRRRVKHILSRPLPITARLGLPGLVAIVLAAVLLLPMARRAVSEDTLVSALVGEQADDFTLEGLKEGTSIHLSDYRGKIVLLGFWATWSKASQEELRILQRVHDRYKERDVAFIGINFLGDRKTVNKFMAKEGYTFPVALDAKGWLADVYDAWRLPTVVLIDREGTVRTVLSGFVPGFKRRLKRELSRLLAGRAPAGRRVKPDFGQAARAGIRERITSADGEELQLAFFDDFSTRRSGLRPSGYSNGHYEIDAPAAYYRYEALPVKLEDFVMEARVKLLEKPEENRQNSKFGLSYRRGINSVNGDIYDAVFFIRHVHLGDGYLSYASKTWECKPPIISKHINQDGWNKIRVESRGPLVRLYINDRFVQVAVQSTIPRKGEMGLHVLGCHVAFDDVAIYQYVQEELFADQPELRKHFSVLTEELEKHHDPDWGAAAEVAEEMARIVPESTYVQDLYAAVHYILGLWWRNDCSGRMVALEQSLRFGVRNPWALSDLATERCHVGKPARAEEAARRAVELEPRFLRARYWLARSLEELERYEEAIQVQEETLETVAISYESHGHIGIFSISGSTITTLGTYLPAAADDNA